MRSDEAAIGGSTVATLAGRIDAVLSTRLQDTFKWTLITIGANDVLSLPAEAAWNANLAYVLDAIHTWRPNVRVGVSLPWRRGYAAECNTLAGRIATVVTARGWAFIGPDERVLIEAGNDGATYTYDGVHWTASGESLMASAWLRSMGY